jgi:hypothetical protein
MYDFRFEITAFDEPEMGCTHLVRMIELLPVPTVSEFTGTVDGREIEAFTTDDPFGAVEAAREAQAYTLEERFDMAARAERDAMAWGDFS